MKDCGGCLDHLLDDAPAAPQDRRHHVVRALHLFAWWRVWGSGSGVQKFIYLTSLESS